MLASTFCGPLASSCRTGYAPSPMTKRKAFPREFFVRAGRRGGKIAAEQGLQRIGGLARAAALSPERRSEIARQGGLAKGAKRSARSRRVAA